MASRDSHDEFLMDYKEQKILSYDLYESEKKHKINYNTNLGNFS